MKVLLLTEANRFEYTEMPAPSVGDSDVLIRVEAVGICGSDVHGMSGKTGRRIPPIVMGHEAAGVVVETGSRVSQVAVGDRVTFDSTVYCNSCPYCRSGRVNLCSSRRVLGVSCAEYRQHGAMAELVAVPQHILYKLPDAVSFEEAAMIEPASIAFHAVRRARIGLGESVAVFGCGIIGLLIIRAARLAGCGKLFAVDVNAGRLEAAREMGADVLIDSSREDPVGIIRSSGEGAEACFEAVGIGPTVSAATESVRKGGRLVLVGNVSPEVTLGLQSVVTREIDLLGSCASSGEYPAILDAIAAGRLSLGPLISVRAPLSQGAEWFRRLAASDGSLLKVILKP
ncbi:MAG: galactitol-1-phosphate 5-dehydrogenase [Spirochaetes bacterium]|nr:galactitol-1-phosphate 5-dehydrogenase [Spirochaetota bacterium]